MEFNGTFLATIISFTVFVFLMNKVLYAPILKIMEKRENIINENYASAKENDTKSEELSNEKDKTIKNAKIEARCQYISSVEEYKDKKAEIIASAHDTNKNELQLAKTELINLSNDTKDGLKLKMTELASDIVEKVLGYRSEVQNFDNDKINDILYK